MLMLAGCLDVAVRVSLVGFWPWVQSNVQSDGKTIAYFMCPSVLSNSSFREVLAQKKLMSLPYRVTTQYRTI